MPSSIIYETDKHPSHNIQDTKEKKMMDDYMCIVLSILLNLILIAYILCSRRSAPEIEYVRYLTRSKLA